MFNHCSAELTPGSRERTQALIQLSRLTASHTAEEPAKRAHRRPTELLQMSREPAKRHVEMGCFRRRIRTLDEEQRRLRVNLLIADDVGAGKTVEAGLVLREMLLRRRAWSVRQWQDELEAKFGLSFVIADRERAADDEHPFSQRWA